ncbi:MAG: histidine kinase [Bacteroidales bacterium]
MKKVIGYRLQVAGCPRLWAAVLIVFILFGFSFPGSGLGRKYSFKVGEVLDYEVIEKWNDSRPGTIPGNTIWKYRFTVESAEKEKYCLSMRLVSMYLEKMGISFSEQTMEIYPELRSNLGRARILNSEVNAEMNHPITFTLDSRGTIIDLQGDEKIREVILQAAEEMPEIKEIINYHTIAVRYGIQKYKYLIHEFFPAIPESFIDTVCLESGKNSVSRINTWHPRSIFPGMFDTILLKRAYTFRNGDLASGCIPANDTINDMVIYWPKSSGYPHQIRYKGYSPENIVNGLTEIPIDPEMIGQVEIINTDRTNTKTSKVKITGSISHLVNKKMTASLPGSGISREVVPIKPDQNGTFSLNFDLDISADLVGLEVSPGDTNLIRLFVKQGDSLSLSVDLNDLKTLEFRGTTSRVQKTLNQLSRTNVWANPLQSIQNVRSNMDYLAQQNLNLDEAFLQFMEMEYRYTLYARQIEKVWKPYSVQSHVPLDSIRKFRKYLGNPDGYKSNAYKGFIQLMVRAYFEATMSDQTDYFDFAPAILTGWDLYWYRAMWAEIYISNSPDGTYDRQYMQFSDLYPGTEFQRILYEKYKLTEKGRTGNILPKFKLTDITGKTYSFRDFRGKYWCMIITGDDDEKTKLNIWLAEKYNREHNDNVTFYIWTKNDATRELIRPKISSKKIILLAGSDMNQALAKFITGLPEDIMVIDPFNRIATYGISSLPNLLTWPKSKNPNGKTINLTVFWYSLAGAFTLSVIIILTIRIRSKRREARLNLKRRIAQLEVDAVRSRMNPHFLFNALGSIQNLVNRGKNQEASLYLARFGDLVRTILTQSSKPVIGLNEEIDMIRNYLQLEQLGFPFAFDIQVDPALDPATIEVPPLLIQPHVENAVIHGISSLGAAGKIGVNFRLEDQHLICEVTDNGPGYHPGSRPEKEGLGQGWKLTRQRIQLMKEQYGEEVSVEVTSRNPDDKKSSDSSGTTVTFRLPMQKSTL